MDYWRELLSSQNPDCWESTRCNAITHNSPNSRVRQPLCDFKDLSKVEKRENQSLVDLLVYMDMDLGVFHEVSLINSPPAFTLTKREKYQYQIYNPGTSP